MSVDERIREGFQRNGDVIDADPEHDLIAVASRARRHLRIRRAGRAASIVVAAGVILVAMRWIEGQRVLDGRISMNHSTPSPVVPHDPLEGSWIGTSSCAQRRAALEEAGLVDDANRLNVTCARAHTVTMVFAGGVLASYGDAGRLGWRGSYEVVGAHTFVAGHESFGSVLYLRYQFAIDGDKLVVHLLRDAYPHLGHGRNGRAGDRVAQTMAWNSSVFHRTAVP